MNYNKVILAGRLVRDPQLKYTTSQTAICEFGLAVNEKWKDKGGQQKEDTCFVDCTCFGKQAETFTQYMKKGRCVLIDGRLKLDRWDDKDGNKRSKHTVTVSSFQFVGAKDDMPASPPQMPPQRTPLSPPDMNDPLGELPDDYMPTGSDIPF